MLTPTSKRNDNAWSSSDSDKLWLLTEAEFQALPDGTTVYCIDGAAKVKGTDYIDNDTRFGMLAYGLRESQLT